MLTYLYQEVNKKMESIVHFDCLHIFRVFPWNVLQREQDLQDVTLSNKNYTCAPQNRAQENGVWRDLE